MTQRAEHPAASGPIAPPRAGHVVVVAEKPSVARDIAIAIGARQRGEGCLHGGGFVVTWAVGHLVALAEPQQIDAAWRAWRRESLPMLPRQWPLVVIEETQAQFGIVRKLINDPATESVVCATDAGREGELIFRFIYEASRCLKPVRRLWISSLTPDAIRAGFRAVKDSSQYDRLASAARGRAQADWLVGMNLSRAYSLAHDEKLSVGRVQTPTLAMVVEREQEIMAFVPEDYVEVLATFAPEQPPSSGPSSYKATWFRFKEGEDVQRAARDGRRLPSDATEARAIIDRVRARGRGVIESISEETKQMPPLLLYDLTELQRHANRLFGFTAKKTLDVAQALYETHKLLSYPRTDSRHLSADVAATLPQIVAAIRAPYEGRLAAATGTQPLSRRFIDDSKVTDHHAIIPTATDPRPIRLDGDEQRIYDLVCRRLLAAWHDDHVTAVTTIITRVDSTTPGDAVIDRFHTAGTTVVREGWKVLDPGSGARAKPAGGDETELPQGLARGQLEQLRDIASQKKQTRPPRRFTDAALLTAMETAGRALDDRELSRAMRDCGLGTPATRAAIIETLLARAFLVREAKLLKPTPKGIHLIDLVHPDVKSPAMTGEWESKLRGIERGEGELASFMKGIEDYVRSVVGTAFSARRAIPAAVAQPVTIATPAPKPEPPRLTGVAVGAAAHENLRDALTRVFGFERFRPYQEAVCQAVVDGQDVLLVMPTGAGKSLCYQLPGLVRRTTTLVVSPLIALMEDQVAKLQKAGLRADRIHSGRGRVDSRAARDEYLAGRLDFLYIAPERLAAPGFLELLAERPLGLVAIDEAHCISHWGHDFRPEYRMLGQRLPTLRPASIIALTATATPLVQKDIAEQLGLKAPRHFIHGFRRENIAIEVIEVPKPDRAALARRILEDPERRPAILYAPTRKGSVEIAASLASDFPAAPYHAGLTSSERDATQAGFNRGDLEIVVATIAFGMGVDKADIRSVIHLALPQTIEGYYQEIGRAGRDGKPARAVLMHSYADRKVNEFLRERAYPGVDVLQQVFAMLGTEPRQREEIKAAVRIDADIFDNALEKLWIHGGALIGDDDAVRRGHSGWVPLYLAQQSHRAAQEEEMARFTRLHGCRMVHLVRHFGDEDDRGEPCAICDDCAQVSCVARSFRRPSAAEQVVMSRLLDALHDIGSTSTGRLFRDVVEGEGVERQSYEAIVSGLSRAGLVIVQDDDFEKDGRRIAYQRIRLTPKGRTARPGDLGEVAMPEAAAAASRRPARAARKRTANAASHRASFEAAQAEAPPVAPPPPALVEALRAWRLAESRRKHIPAFRIMTDRALIGIAASRPRTEADLLAVHGIGPAFVSKYGGAVLAIVGGTGAAGRTID